MNPDDRAVCNAARKLNVSTGATLAKWEAKVSRSGIEPTVRFIAEQLKVLDPVYCRAQADYLAVKAFGEKLDRERG